MRRPFAVTFVAALGCIAALACGARADVIFLGNARALAMGGAGLAVVDRRENTSRANPASLALLSRRFVVDYPGFGFRARGIPIEEAFKHLTGNPDRNNTVDLARDFGKRDSSFGVRLDWGVRAGHLEAFASGIAVANLYPNEALKNWARTGNGDVSLLAGTGARADMIAAGIYSLPTIGIAERISPSGSPTRIQAGVRVKLQRSVYTHYIATEQSIINDTDAIAAPELGGGTTITKDGIGLDAGILIHPRDFDGLSGAVVVSNLVGTTFRFNGTDRNGNPVVYELQPATVAAGSAWQNGRTLVALDLVDINSAYGNSQARFGAEYRTRGLALRGGYSSREGFTGGFGWGFLDVAVGSRVPLEISRTLRF